MLELKVRLVIVMVAMVVMVMTVQAVAAGGDGGMRDGGNDVDGSDGSVAVSINNGQ